ncbi:MAG: NAD(P)-dependent oxidoreductase [Candidatus Omnitrophota bacterium]
MAISNSTNPDFPSPSPLRILVTGASGFVGLPTTQALIRRGHRVIAAAHILMPDLPAHPQLQWIKWDATEEPLPQIEWDGLDAILHLAIPCGHFAFPDAVPALFETTVASVHRLYQEAYRRGVQRVLIASTGDVLGSREQPAAEDDFLYQPDTFYGTAKACAELFARFYQSHLTSSILRFYHPYGPGGDRFLINQMIRWIAEGREIAVEGAEGIRLNPVWVEDLAQGVCLAVEKGMSGIFHFGGPDYLSLRQLADMIGSIMNKKPIITSKDVPCIQRHAGAFAETSRLLDYHPQTSIRAGLEKLIELKMK